MKIKLFTSIFSIFVLISLLDVTLGRRIFETNERNEVQKIINGKNGYIENNPFLVSIKYEGDHMCGGAIITKRHIVTAAHCFEEEEYRGSYSIPQHKYSVVTGATLLSKGGTKHVIKNITVNSHLVVLHRLTINDIAVVVLEKRIVLDYARQPIKLPNADYPGDGSKGKIMGWGYTAYAGKYRPENVQPDGFKVGYVKVLNYKQCNDAWRDDVARDLNICSTRGSMETDKNVGTCFLDSGSPLVVNKTLVGIVSWGDYCSLSNPDVYTNVFKYLDFIEDTIDAYPE